MVFSTKRFYKRKDTMCHYGYIQNPLLVIAWTHWQRFRCFPSSWYGFSSMHTTGRSGVIRHFIDVQDIFHAGYKFCIFFVGYTSNRCGEVEVRFFKTLRMVSLLTGVSISARHPPPPKVGVHLECPLRHRGCRQSESDALQPRPSALRNAALEFGLILYLMISVIPFLT